MMAFLHKMNELYLRFTLCLSQLFRMGDVEDEQERRTYQKTGLA